MNQDKINATILIIITVALVILCNQPKTKPSKTSVMDSLMELSAKDRARLLDKWSKE